MDYPLTEKQQSTLDKAIELLQPFNKELVSYNTYYFEDVDEDGERIGNHEFSEYDCCSSDDCIEKTLAELKENHPNEIIDYRGYLNDGDHERFERCYQCECYLNEFLTWIETELDWHIENTLTKDELISSTNAFEISGCLYSMHWNADKRMGTHQATYHHDEGIKQQKDFIKKVVDYANHIVKTLE